MASRPTFIDLQSQSSEHVHLDTCRGRVATSPRWHFPGDTTPDLSPLDAFAAHSRSLARQLQRTMDESSPVAASPGSDPSNFGHIGYFSTDPDLGVLSHADLHQPLPAHKVEIEVPDFRPSSIYSRLGDARGCQRGRSPTVRQVDESGPESSVQADHSQAGLQLRQALAATAIFQEDASIRCESRSILNARGSHSAAVPFTFGESLPDMLVHIDEGCALLPRDSSHARSRRASNPLSGNDHDDAEPANIDTLTDHAMPALRSSSMHTNLDLDQWPQMPTMNFSRPLSRASLPPESVWRRPSFEHPRADTYSKIGLGSIVDMHGRDVADRGMDASHTSPILPLPRGKTLPRDCTSSDRIPALEALKDSKLPLDDPLIVESPPHSSYPSRQSSPVRPSKSPLRSPFDVASSSSHVLDGSAEYHVTKGIACHERGSLNESTYHLRLAAKMNHPTGMLLYALACRHGWGMRPNQKDGVLWLRRAADSAILELVEDGHPTLEGSEVDVATQRVRRAQFSLSVYELGVSHLNGWGTEQDRTLALRCFEIAGSWGDADALAEAGFCYAQGLGCKKDLRRSARFYRMAASRGISMVGNSWIYKTKYADDSAMLDTAIKKPRSKSRSRSIFGRLKTKS